MGGERLWVPGLCTLLCPSFSKEKKREAKWKKKKKITSKRKHQKPQTKTKPNHQLKYTKYTFTKGGDRDFLFISLVTWSYKQTGLCPSEPQGQHIVKQTWGGAGIWGRDT